MRTVIASHELLPRGLKLESLSIETGHVSICVGSGATRCICPVCGHRSARAHSRYHRTVSDLPWHGISVTLKIRARRFFCDDPSCKRKIFCERLPHVAARDRKTSRLEEALPAIALELGGRAGARLALELGIVAARDTLLRRIKAAPLPEVGKGRVLGVDDFAFENGSTYGTILVNLEEHKGSWTCSRSAPRGASWPGWRDIPARRWRWRPGTARTSTGKNWPKGLPTRRTWQTAGICSTTSHSRWKSTCSRNGPY